MLSGAKLIIFTANYQGTASYMKRSIGLFILFIGLSLIGCGGERSPMAQDQSSIPVVEGRMVLSFSPDAAQRAGKLAQEGQGRQVNAVFASQGGSMEIFEDQGTPPKKDDLRSQFSVPEDGVTGPVEISMTVYGQSLSELLFQFTPSGLVFNSDAQLEILIGKDWVDLPLDDLVAYHEHEDGTVEYAQIVMVEDWGAETRILISIPGFSRYSMGGGE